ncbi:MAG: hypothetical protein WCK86_10245 [Planctomycetia bacterium]
MKYRHRSLDLSGGIGEMMLSEFLWGLAESKNLVEASKSQPCGGVKNKMSLQIGIRDGIFGVSTETGRMADEKSLSPA